MHIPDGFVSMPVAATTLLATLGVGVIAHKKINLYFNEDESRLPMVAASAAFVFAAQMLNFPILSGTSGHFLGAGFATAMFGPWVSFLILSVVLLIQCLIFGDGGVTAIGSNIFLMGVVAPWVFYGVHSLLKKYNFYLSIGVGSWLSVVAASVACSLLVGLSGVIEITKMLSIMIPVHSLLGIGEALITVSAVKFVEKTNTVKGLHHENA